MKNQALVYKGTVLKNANNVNIVLNKKTPYKYLKCSKHTVTNTMQINMYKINLYIFLSMLQST